MFHPTSGPDPELAAQQASTCRELCFGVVGGLNAQPCVGQQHLTGVSERGDALSAVEQCFAKLAL